MPSSLYAAIASGDVQIGYVGSSPFAAATSKGLEVKAFYLASISGTDEALVVRNGSGIEKPADLKGKRLAAAPDVDQREREGLLPLVPGENGALDGAVGLPVPGHVRHPPPRS